MVERDDCKCATHRYLFGLCGPGGVAFNIKSIRARQTIGTTKVLLRGERMQLAVGAKGLRNPRYHDHHVQPDTLDVVCQVHPRVSRKCVEKGAEEGEVAQQPCAESESGPHRSPLRGSGLGRHGRWRTRHWKGISMPRFSTPPCRMWHDDSSLEKVLAWV